MFSSMSQAKRTQARHRPTVCISKVSRHRENRSHKVPEWLQLFKEGLPDEAPDPHNVVVVQNVVLPKEKTLDDLRVSSEEESTDLPSIANPTTNETAQETMNRLQKFVPPDQKTRIIHTHNSLKFIRACEDLCSNQDESTPYPSDTHGIAEHLVRRVKRRYLCSVGSVGSSRKRGGGEAMKCFCHLRNIQDKLADRKLPYERNFGTPFDGPGMLFGAEIHSNPISTRDTSRLHQLGTRKLPGIFIGYTLNSGGGWTVDLVSRKSKEVGINNFQKVFVSSSAQLSP